VTVQGRDNSPHSTFRLSNLYFEGGKLPSEMNTALMTDEEVLETLAEAGRRQLLTAHLGHIPDYAIAEELRRRSIDFDLAYLPGSLLARELVRRRKYRPAGQFGHARAGRPAHPMRDAIRAERAAGAKLAELARRYGVSVRTISRIARQ